MRFMEFLLGVFLLLEAEEFMRLMQTL